MDDKTPPERAFRRGHFVTAYQLLRRTDRLPDEYGVMTAELLEYLGYLPEAETEALRLLNSKHLSTSLQSRCTSILAARHWYGGKLDAGLALYQRAVRLAEIATDVPCMCRATAQLLERTCDSVGFSSSLPLASLTRRYAIRCGDPQISVLVHLSFGRLEAKAGHFDIAERHFRLAREILELDPNLYLAASLDLDEAGMLWLMGDISEALSLAESGAIKAGASGWSRGKVAAAGTLACLYVCVGRHMDVDTQIRLALAEPFSSPSYRLALADTKARAAIAVGHYQEAAWLLEQNHYEGREVQPWYELTAAETQIRLLLGQGACHEALALLDRSIRAASAANIQPLLVTFELARCEALIAAGITPTYKDVPLDRNADRWPPGLIGYLYATIGAVLAQLGHTDRGAGHIARSLRVFETTGDVSARRRTANSAGATETFRRPNGGNELDSVVALLELSGHPSILGREVVAVLRDTGCVESAAFVATHAEGVRVIASFGWAEQEAVGAFRAAHEEELIHIGQYRDETLEIVIRPRPEMDHRFSLLAVRKILASGNAIERQRREERRRAALWPTEALDSDPESLWASEQSAELMRMARRIAATLLPVLITGETGTGKEMLARIIHSASDRANGSFQPFNCTAVSRDMIESQLFGYRKGAFTGADASFPGVIRAAAGGTLFLDEIGEIPIEMQPKLLRFLEQHEVHPLGEPHPVKVDVRVVAATNSNLDDLVAQGRFREDLFYRLNVIRLKLPPLRERREEIPGLLQHYIRRHSEEQRKGQLTLSDEALEYLLLYSWPGNIRQLANEVRRMVALAEPDSTLTPALLSPEILASRRTVPAAPVVDPEIRLRLDQPLPAAVELLEQMLVRRALERSHGRVEEAARLLGISRKGLFLKRRRWGLERAS